MFYQTEAKPQGWRAVAVFDDRPDALIFVGRSSTQVRQEFTEVRTVKPKASRAESSEVYLVATGFRP